MDIDMKCIVNLTGELRDGPYKCSVFPSEDEPGRIFIDAKDCRLTPEQAVELRNCLNHWLARFKLDMRTETNLNVKALDAIRGKNGKGNR